MTLIYKTTLAVALGISLSACGGGGTDTGVGSGPTASQKFDAYTNSFTATGNNIQTLSTASPSVMNRAQGTARFDGEGVIFINPTRFGGEVTSAEVSLIGDAVVNVNFDNGSVTGSVTDMVGVGRSNVVDEYTGTVRVRNGDLVGGGSSLISGNYYGTVTGNGRTHEVGGPLDGVLFGSSGVTGVGLIGDDLSAGGSVSGTSQLLIVADR